MADRIFSAEQIKVPPELPALLRDFSKAAIRDDPTEGKTGPEARAQLAAFAVKYFSEQIKQ